MNYYIYKPDYGIFKQLILVKPADGGMMPSIHFLASYLKGKWHNEQSHDAGKGIRVTPYLLQQISKEEAVGILMQAEPNEHVSEL